MRYLFLLLLGGVLSGNSIRPLKAAAIGAALVGTEAIPRIPRVQILSNKESLKKLQIACIEKLRPYLKKNMLPVTLLEMIPLILERFDLLAGFNRLNLEEQIFILNSATDP